MIINIGDTIEDTKGRQGEIVNIGIATERTDIAAENDTSLNAQTYDTELGYTGAITFGGSNWCYFNQIKEVSTKDDSDVDIAIEQANEWWK